jgi:hypothetical protein
MKYIITETKLNDIRKDYIENRIGSDHDFEEFIIVNYPFRGDDEDDEVMMEYDHTDGRLWVNSSFGRGFADLFFPNDEEAYKFISEWFEWKYGVEVKFTQS